MFKIRKNDLVQVIKGKDKGKKGKVLRFFPDSKRAIVEGINTVKQFKRKTQQDPQGGIVSVEAPISISNLAFFCKKCNRGVRLGYMLLKDGEKSRFCKSCKEVV